MNMLEGKKTYAVAALVLLVVIVEKVAGIDIPGIDIGDDWLNYVMSALGLTALRNAMGR